MFRVFWETDECSTEPYPVERVEGTQVFITVKGHELRHILDKVILVEEFNRLFNGDSSINTLYSVTRQFRSTKPKGSSTKPNVYITEVLHQKDPRNYTPEPLEANERRYLPLFREVLEKSWRRTFPQVPT